MQDGFHDVVAVRLMSALGENPKNSK